MGICVSSPMARKNGGLNWPATAKVIHLDGKLKQFILPIKAGQVLSQNPNCFLCSSESMYVDCQVPHVPDEEELQLGQIYFLMPLSQSPKPLSLQDLCALAIKASAAVADSDAAAPISNSNGVGLLHAGPQGCCKIPMGLDTVGRSNRSIEF